MGNTGPSKKVRHEVYARDGYACVRCGSPRMKSIQHRQGRGMGGSSDPAINLHPNLATLCGTGTLGCHGYVESHPIEARKNGWSVPRSADPATWPMLTTKGWVLLLPDARVQRLIPLDDLIERWAPGDEWPWDVEESALLSAPCHCLGDTDGRGGRAPCSCDKGSEVGCCPIPGHYQHKLELFLRERGRVEQGVFLGTDGRVWDGHHRIIAARRIGFEMVPLEEGSAA